MARIYPAMQHRDADELRTALAHDIEWTPPEGVPWGGTRHGPDGIDSLNDIFQAHVEGSSADPDDLETHSLMSFRAPLAVSALTLRLVAREAEVAAAPCSRWSAGSCS